MKEFYALIPGRKNSKGIPNKNIFEINGENLIQRAANQANKIFQIQKIFITTDYSKDEINFKSEKKKFYVNRPKNLCTDKSLTIDVVIHTLNKFKIETGWLFLLQPTSPIRRRKHFLDLINLAENSTKDERSFVSVFEFRKNHPCKSQKIVNNKLISFTGCESMVPRQNLPKAFALNGSFYLCDISIILKHRTFLPFKKTVPYIMSEDESINLDTIEDLNRLKEYIKLQSNFLNFELDV